MPTELRLFGRPEALHDGHVSVLAAERRCQLLAFLALQRGWVNRAELAALLWPEREAALAQANVRKALHFARALPWAGALEASAGTVRFDVFTDVAAFDAAAREGRAEEALRLVRGVLLDGLEDESNPAWSEWLAGERRRVAGAWRDVALGRLGELDGAPHECAALARELLHADPLDEEALVALLQVLQRLGRHTEAREAYRSFAARLDEELHVAPAPRVRALLADVEPEAAPAGTSGLVGRARELEELCALLERSECRLLTVTGPGGVGKSHTVKEALRRLAQRFAGGAIWVPLDDLTETTQVVARIATELGIAPAPLEDPLREACAHARMRHLLLVLDNAEHLAALPRVVERLLAEAPGVKVCATSRARLGVRGEWLLPLHGLALPPAPATAAEVLACDAAKLFVATALAVRPDFEAGAHAQPIGALVRAVGGLPLAILLAANWARLLPVPAILAELTRSLDVLESADEGEERPEHRSMRATFELSWRLLAPNEQRALAMLAVFPGTFPLAAAAEVTGAPLTLLGALADKSLLQMLPLARCALHPLIRQFASERLDVAAREDANARHAAWFDRWLAARHAAAAAGEPPALDAIDAELENVRAAWRWAIAARAADAVARTSITLLRFFEVRGRAAEGLALLQEALAPAREHVVAAPSCAAQVLSSIAHLHYRLYRLDEAVAMAREALKPARAARARDAVFRCLNVLGLSNWQWGRNREARRIIEQSLRHAAAGGDERNAVIALGNLAVVEKALGNYARAHALMRDVLERQRALGDWVGVATRLNNIAALHQAQAQWAEARERLRQGLEVCAEHGIAFTRPHLLVNLALVAFFAGEYAEAARVGEETLLAARAEANRNVEATALLVLVRVAVRAGRLADARAHLGRAIEDALAMGAVPLQLDCLFCAAEILAGEGDVRAARSLIRYYLARPEVESGDREQAQSCLDGLPDPGEEAPLPDEPLALLLARTRGGRGTAASPAPPAS